MTDLHLRALDAADLEHIDWCLYTAVTWSPEREGYPREAVLGHPSIVLFREGWGRPGDFGVLATADGARVGVAFGRLFTVAAHSSGFIDERTPEIAIAVERPHRGQGVGRVLLDALADAALAHGMDALSLSVDEGNPAEHLYERAGYATVSRIDGDVVMIRRLD